MKTKGFTLVELMVVVLIVGILAAVAIPLMRGRIDAAKWSEGRAGAGTFSTAIRAYIAEGQDPNGLTSPSDFGFADGDLDGTYFTDECYSVEFTDGDTYVISIDATLGTDKKPTTTPTTRTLSVDAGAATWSDISE